MICQNYTQRQNFVDKNDKIRKSLQNYYSEKSIGNNRKF